jgi:hypothetical protein
LQQFGGVSATHIDWTMVPHVRKSFYKHWANGMKYLTYPDIEPTHYLDKFIDYSENCYSGAYNSVELSVLKRARFTTSVEYRLRLTNNYHDDIILNTNKTTSCLVLVASDGKYKKPVALSLSGKAETIPSGQAREYEATFNINEDMDFLLYNVFVLKDVSYTGMGGTSSLEYYM